MCGWREDVEEVVIMYTSSGDLSVRWLCEVEDEEGTVRWTGCLKWEKSWAL